MEPITIDVTQNTPYGQQKTDSSISFRSFIKLLESRVGTEQTFKRNFFQLVLDKLRADPRFTQNIPLSEIGNYREQLSLVYGMLMPPVTNEEEIFWALGAPVSPIVFYGTSGFYHLITEKGGHELRCDLIDDKGFSFKQKAEMLYSFILERLYQFPAFHNNNLIITLKDDRTRLQKYYRLNIDTRFCEVYPKDELPRIDIDQIRNELMEHGDVTRLAELLPHTLFRFEGFSILTLTDVTAEHAVENIKSAMLERGSYDNGQSYFGHVAESLRMLVGNPEVNFGLIPLLKVNNKVAFDKSFIPFSRMMKAAERDDIAEQMYKGMAEAYFHTPKTFFLRTADRQGAEVSQAVEMLRRDGLQSYALLPLFFEKKIVGVLEAFSETSDVVDEKVAARLDIALPLVAQMMNSYIEEFNTEIENVVRDRFTSLQPAVQWKFRETAWHYLAARKKGKSQAAVIEPVFFRDVYPLYGAIDIRNSTIERNQALRSDLECQFIMLIDTLTVLKQKLGFNLTDELIFKCRRWLAGIMDPNAGLDELRIVEFLENEAHPFLHHFRENAMVEVESSYAIEEPGAAELIDRYFAAIDEETGAANTHRRDLESSMQKINASVSTYLDLFKTEIQQSYPCYFEKFRTDGIEYDIYIGQSIEPGRKFSELYLKNIRLWQLTSMAAITRITHALISQMEKPLQTTQLIFIHSNSIDISFRDDERRFDVEGSYNIRYQVIKKRIDKVHIKDTGERLVQPGKIAMVYSNNKSADEYAGYIRFLQEKNTLLNDLEYLDLEELQGVSGLKALRVGVNLEADWD
ncbi:GAF domain-containing protein [Dyadobacter sandarakinus]|uniref:GAF domain-containing protein n=1 Tax=Dyadobacter sandarakinus TaxID=2747268 RepID=A0ABX7ICQ3_9BACT|nr:GAF domain-containing protein [Dyadobacter sandarakinus]QRR03901.1 GAF domain-containing protein [Dyadobacter sandarakinus]